MAESPRNSSKILSLILAAAIGLGSGLTGCSKKTDDDTDNNDNTVATATTTTTTSAPPHTGGAYVYTNTTSGNGTSGSTTSSAPTHKRFFDFLFKKNAASETMNTSHPDGHGSGTAPKSPGAMHEGGHASPTPEGTSFSGKAGSSTTSGKVTSSGISAPKVTIGGGGFGGHGGGFSSGG